MSKGTSGRVEGKNKEEMSWAVIAGRGTSIPDLSNAEQEPTRHNVNLYAVPRQAKDERVLQIISQVKRLEII